MIGVIDKDPIDLETLRNALDELDPSTDDTIPKTTGIQSLAERADGDRLPEETVDDVIEEIPEALRHDQSAVHRIGALAGTVLVDVEPAAADRLLDTLVPLLEETTTERQTMETIEYVSTAAPEAVGERLAAAVDRLDHPRHGVARHAVGTVLAVASESPDAVIGWSPRLVASLTDSFEPVTDASREVHGGNLEALEHNRRLEHAITRLLGARVVATLAEARPEEVTDALLEADATDALVSLFDDQRQQVRAAAVGVASHVAEREPESIEPAIPRLVALLDDENEVVRGSAIWTLRALDHPDAAKGLREAAREEPSEELRELAAASVEPVESDAGRK